MRKRKILSCCITVMVLLLFGTISVQAITRDDAVKWAKTQIGTAYDVDGIYGYQCSDFGSAYINYIIYGDPYYWRNSGHKGFTTYMGYNYFNLSYPSGWQRIANTTDFVPQPGDILCFGANSSNSEGHVAVAIEGCTTSTIYGVGQNGAANDGNGEAVKRETMAYYGSWGNFQGVIRPKWDNITKPTAPTNCLSESWDDRVQIQWDRVNNADYYECGLIDINTRKTIVKANVNDWYYNFYSVPEGQYWAYVCAHNSAGTSSHSNWYRVDVTYKVPAAPAISLNTDVTAEGNYIQATWDAVAGAEQYEYYVTEFPGGYAYTTNTRHGYTSDTNIVFPDLGNGRYSMFIHAISRLGKWSPQSNWVTFDIYAKDYIPTEIISHNNNIYALYDYEMSWSFARDLCTDLGGHLVTITSDEENQIIKNLINYGEKDSYWLGASDYDREEKDYEWITGEAFEFSDWATGEPNASGVDGEKEHFAEIKKTYGNKWNDVNNINKTDQGFILEIETQNITPTAIRKFNGNTYMLFDRNTTWTEAERYCEMLGGHLVAVGSDDENEFLKEFLQSGNRNWYYIGATKNGDKWQWIDDNNFSNITWKDTSSDWNGHYLMMYKDSKACVGFNNAYFPERDIKCIGFVCEIEQGRQPNFSVSLSIQSNNISVCADIVNIFSPAVYIAASYTSDNRLLDVQSLNLQRGAQTAEVSLTKQEGAKYIKVFLWDSVSNMMPLCDYEKIDL